MILKAPLSLAITIIVVINLVLFSMRKINIILFWIIIGLAAFYTYFIMHKIK